MKVVILAGGRGTRTEYFCHVPLAITRCGNLYGGSDLNYNRLVPGTIRTALLGERPIICSDDAYVLNQATNEIPSQYLDCAKARRTLDWEAAYPLEAGLCWTIAWYRSHLTLSSDVTKA